MRVNMSAIGSVMLMRWESLFLSYPSGRGGCVGYQLAFLTPGIIPDSANSLKQIRHRPKRRRYARERPHRAHRVLCRTLNFGFRFAFSSNDFGGIYRLFPSSTVLNGIPSSLSKPSA